MCPKKFSLLSRNSTVVIQMNMLLQCFLPLFITIPPEEYYYILNEHLHTSAVNNMAS